MPITATVSAQRAAGWYEAAPLEVLRQDHVLLRKDLEVLSAGFRKDLDVQAISFHKDLELLSTTMTLRLGSMLIVGLSVLFAALKLTE
jgi:hypothetical protein